MNISLQTIKNAAKVFIEKLNEQRSESGIISKPKLSFQRNWFALIIADTSYSNLIRCVKNNTQTFLPKPNISAALEEMAKHNFELERHVLVHLYSSSFDAETLLFLYHNNCIAHKVYSGYRRWLSLYGSQPHTYSCSFTVPFKNWVTAPSS